MKKTKEKQKNSLRILHQTSANLSKAFATTSIFKLRKKRFTNAEISKKYLHNGRIEYCSEQKENRSIYVYNTVLAQTHLDILTLLVPGSEFYDEKDVYVKETSFYQISGKINIQKKYIKQYLLDLKNAVIKIQERDALTMNIISALLYKQENERKTGIFLLFDSIFIHYFMFIEKSLNLPKTIQMQIIELETGIAKGIARYCYAQRQVYREVWDILYEIDKEEYGYLGDKKRKIRAELKKDIESLQKLGIFIDIEYDTVYFKNPLKEREVVYSNNNPKILQYIHNRFLQRIQNPIQNTQNIHA